MDLKAILKTTPEKIKILHSKGIKNLYDFIKYLPRDHEIRIHHTKLADADISEKISIECSIINKTINSTNRFSKGILKINAISPSNENIEITIFGKTYLDKTLKIGDSINISGKFGYEFGKYKISNPEISTSSMTQPNEIISIYTEPEGLNSSWIRDKIELAFRYIKENHLEIPEYIPSEIIQQYNFIPYFEALKAMHMPQDQEILKKAQQRLAFDELFLLQIGFIQRKYVYQSHTSKMINNETDEELGKIIKQYIDILDFELTNDQKVAIYEILKDFSSGKPMLRLLQGDVGSGKTLVAEITAYFTNLKGFQTAFMAPTETLAKQHFESIKRRFEQFGIKTELIIGSMSKNQKQQIKEDLRYGKINCIIGTHALIQEDISFKNLGYVVIDEQHKFGVEQRKILAVLGYPHVLHMTATPIPRTLALAFAGDQDVSTILHKPKGRLPIITKVIPQNTRTQMYSFINSEIQKDKGIYVICPLIEISDKEGMDEIKAVTDEYENLKIIFPNYEIGLLHGKMTSEDKEKVMSDFKNKHTKILVSTTVIEVGIDVPDATVIVIEGAERFGLSQLHQLRGRVGRSLHQSYCFLCTTNEKNEYSKRLKIMERTNDGFEIAKADLEIRGPGEVYGLRQSGVPDLQIASYSDYDTLKIARSSAIDIISKDPNLNNHPNLQKKLNQQEIIRA